MKTRKLTALLLALCMLLSLSISAFAADDAVVSGEFRIGVVELRLREDGAYRLAEQLLGDILRIGCHLFRYNIDL